MINTYRNFAPTGFDHKGLGLPDRQDWLVAPVGRNHDSGVLDESNFEVALNELGGESETVEVHRFGHWACGWFEIILCHPDHEAALADLEAALSDYPILDEFDYSDREDDAIMDYWGHMSMSERIDLCAREGASIFAARRESPPDAGVRERIQFWVFEG